MNTALMKLGHTLHRLRRIASNKLSPSARALHSMWMLMQNCTAGRPLSAGLGDPNFRGRFVDVPAIVTDWFAPYASIEGAEVLDFGCGEGISALGLALGFRPQRIVGVDIMQDPERCLSVAKAHLGIDSLPASVQLYRVEAGHLYNAADQFDLAYSWSVFEHVDQTLVDHSLSLVHSALRPGGLFLVQIAPLYYSAEGSHLSHVLNEPWIHLRMQLNRLEDLLRRTVTDVDEANALWSTYCTLNKITHQTLIARIRKSGFEVLRTLTTTQEITPPTELLDAVDKDALLTNQVVVLARRLSS